MTVNRADYPGSGARPAAPWRVVLATTLRRHASEALVPILTASLVVVFAVVGYALIRHGAA